MSTIPCPCPPLAGGEPRHDQDTVEFKPRLGFVEAAAIRNRIHLRAQAKGEDEGLEFDESWAVLTEGYMLHGIDSWTLEDADGKPLPVTKANIRERILDDWSIASVLADDADALYAEAVMLPLLRAAATSSQPSPTDASTSPSPDSGPTPPTPLRPSSTTTTPTDDTAMTSESRAGGSRSSRSSTSVA